MDDLRHLAGRFAESVRSRGPDPADDAWARGRLTPAERRLWDRMRPMDRAHAVEVARRVQDDLGPVATVDVVVAALMHDCGKVVADLGVAGRVVAAVAGPLVDGDRLRRWRWRADRLGRLADHLDYPPIGAALLAEGGSAPLVVAWARDHHRPEGEWTVDAALGRALARADG